MFIASAILIISIGVAVLNLYGQFKSLRYSDFEGTPDHLFRFGRELPMSFNEAKVRLKTLEEVRDHLDYAQRATKLVSECLAHLEWYELDAIKSYQTVPVWENPVLYILGRFSNLPYYHRYHFTHYLRTLERGFGVCGDSAVVLSQLLEKKQVEHQIVAFGQHVLIEAEIESKLYMLDPDFGLTTEHSIKELAKQPNLTAQYYIDAGFTEADGRLIAQIVQTRDYRYSNVYKFIPKRYLLERASYWLFWYGPIAGIILGMLQIAVIV